MRPVVYCGARHLPRGEASIEVRVCGQIRPHLAAPLLTRLFLFPSPSPSFALLFALACISLFPSRRYFCRARYIFALSTVGLTPVSSSRPLSSHPPLCPRSAPHGHALQHAHTQMRARTQAPSRRTASRSSHFALTAHFRLMVAQPHALQSAKAASQSTLTRAKGSRPLRRGGATPVARQCWTSVMTPSRGCGWRTAGCGTQASRGWVTSPFLAPGKLSAVPHHSQGCAQRAYRAGAARLPSSCRAPVKRVC